MKNTKKLKGLDQISQILTRYNKIVFIIVLAITAVFAYGAFQIKGEVILQDMLPYDHPFLKLQGRFAQIFGSGGSTVAIALEARDGNLFKIENLQKVKNITDEVELWDEVYRLLTVSIASSRTKVVTTKAKGEIVIEALMYPEVPTSQEEIEHLKKKIYSNPAYNGILVSKDGSSALILTEFKENISYERTFELLRHLENKYTDKETLVRIIGYPMLMGWIYSLKYQILMVFAISVAAMILVLAMIYYGNLSGMIVVLANAAILIVWGLGFIGFTGINFSPLLYVIGFLVGARMIGNAHQIAYRFFEELHASGGDRFHASYETMRTMFIPNFAAVITDTAGFAVLAFVKVVLMQQLALIMSFWMLSIIMTGFLVPTICSLLPLRVAAEKWAKGSCQMGIVSKSMMAITRFSIAPGSRYVVAGTILLLFVFCSWQVTKLKIGDSTPGSPIFWSDHTYNVDQKRINEIFDASSENLVLYYEGKKDSVYDPDVLHSFEAFANHMATTLPDIYKSSSSVIDISKMVNLMLHDGDQVWYQLPFQAEQLSGVIGYVRQVTGQATLHRYTDRTMERAQITLFFSDHTSDNLLRIRDAAYGFFKTNPMKIDQGEFKLAGGRIGMEIALNEEMQRSHAIVDGIVLAAIFALCSLSFGSITAGFMLTIPLILANGVAAAYMSIANIGLSINTLPVAAIGVGVGVDFAIYLYSRCREEFAFQNGNWSDTILQSICTCGKAVLYTGLTIILPIITWFIFSDMKFQAEVGFFLAMIMGTNVIFTVTLHPLMLYMIKPKFISKEKGVKDKTVSQFISGLLNSKEVRQ